MNQAQEYVRRTLSVTQRAYALLNIEKATDSKRDGKRVRTISGIATSMTMDRYGDVVMPAGARFTAQPVALWQHDSMQPVGLQVSTTIRETDIPVTIELAEPTESQTLIDRIAEAWESVKLGMVRGLSIGFRPMPDGFTFDEQNWAFTFNVWEWLETSLVTIPANPDAQISIAEVRGYDTARRALAPLGRTIDARSSSVVTMDPDSLRRARRRSDVLYLS